MKKIKVITTMAIISTMASVTMMSGNVSAKTPAAKPVVQLKKDIKWEIQKLMTKPTTNRSTVAYFKQVPSGLRKKLTPVITWVPHYATKIVKPAYDEPVYTSEPIYELIYIDQTVYETHKIEDVTGLDLTVAYQQYVKGGGKDTLSVWQTKNNHTSFKDAEIQVGTEKIAVGEELIGEKKVQTGVKHHNAVTKKYIDYYYNKANPSQRKAP